MPQLSEFEGTWRIARRIEDRWSDRVGLFDGIVRFTPEGAGLRYHEVGELRLPGEARLASSRDYLWRRDGGGIAVAYADGRPFHRIGPGTVVRDTHDCAPDSYAVTYTFAHWPTWRVVWAVCGPRKDYTSISDLVR